MPISPSRTFILDAVFLLTFDIKVASTNLYFVELGGFELTKLVTKSFVYNYPIDYSKLTIYAKKKR